MSRQIKVVITEPGADDARLERLTLGLHEELAAVAEVETPTREAPSGARAVDAVMIGELLVATSASLAAVEDIVRRVQRWLGRGPVDRGVELTSEGRTLRLGAATAEQQEELVDAFLAEIGEDPERHDG